MKIKKIILIFIACFCLTGCTKYISDDNNKRIINEETGQSLPSNILCKPTTSELDEIYNKYLGDCDIKVIKGENQALLSVSDALILASGTVALEACLYKTPMIIAYRGPWILYLGYLLLRCIKRVSLPNIIADKSIVPEIIQKDVTPLNITYEIEELLYNQDRREKNIKELGEVKELLSNKNSALEVAKVIDTELFS